MEGFYKQQPDGSWNYGKNVYNKNYTLTEADHEEHEYPVDGWVWHDEAPREAIVLLHVNDNIEESSCSVKIYFLGEELQFDGFTYKDNHWTDDMVIDWAWEKLK